MYDQRYPTARGHVKISYRRSPNFLERVGGSMVGSVVGLLLVIGACVLLFWNEGRSVYTYDVISEAQRNCRMVGSADFTADHLVNELVYLTGRLGTDQALGDAPYGVLVQAARLRRRVEMYQWVEESQTEEHHERDGSVRTETHYSYTQMWKDHLVSSTSFDDVRHENPREMSVTPIEFTADRVSLGVYTLGPEAVQLLNNWVRLVLSDPHDPQLQLHNNMLYHGSPTYPQVGDVRVSFEFAGNTQPGHEDQVSMVARQGSGHVLLPYESQVHEGYSTLYLHMGRLSMEEVFKQEHSSNGALTWGLRVVGLVLACIGFNMITGIVVTAVDWLPVVREVVGVSAFLLSVALAVSLSLTVMGVAWLRYHPLYALALLSGAALPCLLPKFLSQKDTHSQ